MAKSGHTPEIYSWTAVKQTLSTLQSVLEGCKAIKHASTGPPKLNATEKMPISGMEESNILLCSQTKVGRLILSIFYPEAHYRVIRTRYLTYKYMEAGGVGGHS